MDKRIPGLALLALAVVVVLSITACGSKGGTSNVVTSVAITPTTASVPINSTYEFTATVNLQNTTTTSTSTAVTWGVNGAAGGNATVGMIVSSASDVQVGIYTAPAVVPGTNNGQVNITAVAPQNPGSTTSTATVTSNTAVVTVAVGHGLAITYTSVTVPAGGSYQFSATMNGIADPNATWTVSSVNGGIIGTIDSTGLYTAPSFPPPGASVTITAQDGTATATATAVVVYSDHSLNGPLAFSYTGNDASGFLAAAGSFVSDGNGHIVSGVEDFSSFLTGVSTQVPISGTYLVRPDGRGTASITAGAGTATWQFVLTTSQHALMTRFDTSATGGGTIDQQNLTALVVSNSVLSGPYVFGVSGSDSLFKPAAVAGEFSADGAGTIPATATILDRNDNGTISAGDTTLHGAYSFDAAFPGSGRGTISLTSASTGTLQYAFYVMDSTHAHLVEIDNKPSPSLAGDMFSGPGGTFSSASLTPGNYVFTNGGTVAASAYAAGGVFVSDGAGNVTAGTLDTNTGGTAKTNTTINACAYTVAPATGRIDLKLYTGSGACPVAPGATTLEFAVYQTAQGSAVMLELDAAAVSTGMAYQQQVIPTSTAGNFALGVIGQGVFHNSPASYQTNTDGQVNITASSVTSGNLDINNFNAVFTGDPIASAGSSVGAPGTRGRGTLVLHATNPGVTYNLIYYLIDGSTALLFDQDTTRIATGSLDMQF
jgi:hypothetical protein